MNTTTNTNYYFDTNGLLVFTEAYLLSRGDCCGNGCRHCPYDYINVPNDLREKLVEAKKLESTNEE